MVLVLSDVLYEAGVGKGVTGSITGFSPTRVGNRKMAALI